MNILLPLVLFAGAYVYTQEKKNPSSPPEDKGFKIEKCEKITITNLEKFHAYIDKTLKELITLPEFKDPLKTDPVNFGKKFLGRISPECLKIYENGNFTKNSFIISFMFLLTGVNLYLGFHFVTNWTKYFKSQEELQKYVQSKTQDFYKLFLKKMADFNLSLEELLYYTNGIAVFKQFPCESCPPFEKPKEEPIIKMEGFEYNCSSVKIIDKDKTTAFLYALTKYLSSLPNYKDPYNIDFKTYTLNFMEIMSKECFEKFQNNKMSPIELKIFGFFIAGIIHAYAEIQLDKGPDATPEQEAEYDDYRANVIEPETIGLLTSIGVTMNDVETIKSAVGQKGSYP